MVRLNVINTRLTQSASKCCPPFTNASCGLFAKWIPELNPKDEGHVLSSVNTNFKLKEVGEKKIQDAKSFNGHTAAKDNETQAIC